MSLKSDTVKSLENEVYEEVSQDELDRLRERHAWLVEPIYKASDLVRKMPFFNWVERLQSPLEFKSAAIQLYHHSATFPKVMGMMLGLTSMGENHMMPFYAKHAFGESDHHAMLMRWMLQHGLLKEQYEICDVVITPETNACINLGYQLALEQDRDKWLVTINSGIERCSNDFFKVVAPKMHGLGVGDRYFDVHVSTDEHHSIMGLDFIEPQDPLSQRGKALLSKSLEGIGLWAAMLHSWIGVSLHPRFNLNGSLVG